MNFGRSLLQSRLFRYGGALIAPALALLLYHLGSRLAGGALPTYIFFYPAVIIVAIIAGFGPGLAAVAVSAALTAYWVIPPIGSFAIHSVPDAVGLALFLINGLIMLFVSLLYRRARRKSTMYEAEVTFRDERIRTAESLRISEMRLRLAQDAAKAAAWEWVPATGQDVWSEGVWKLFGLERDRTASSHNAWIETIHPDDRAAVRLAERTAFANGAEFNAEWRVAGSDPVRWLMSRGRPVRDEKDQITLYVGVVMDITDRKQAEEALREQAVLLDYAPVLVRDLDDRIILWNRGMEQMYGFSREEAMGRNPHTLLRTHHPMPLPKIRATIERDGLWEGELGHTGKDGAEITVASLQVFHRNEKGEPEAIIEINQDITPRKRAEEDRERLISELTAALAQVRKLSGMLPICASCKKIRNDEGYWEQIEGYIREHSEAEFSHGLCPDCAKSLYSPYLKATGRKDVDRLLAPDGPAAEAHKDH